MSLQPCALIVDDDPAIRRLVRRLCDQLGYETVEADSTLSAIRLLAGHEFEVAITDLHMPPGPDGMALVRALCARQPSAAVIVLTGQGQITECVEAMRAGANDFVTKPFHAEGLAQTIRASVESMRLPRQQSPRKGARVTGGTRSAPAASLLGTSPAIAGVLALVAQVAPTPATVLITGETGTGKEVVARLIHGNSPRSSGPFVAINCGAVPEHLIESELFGHVRGAFTGATDRNFGRFVEANGGTLFLDEVGELPLAMQVRLLRVLQIREVQAVGQDRATPVDIRVIAATNRVPAAMVAAGTLREDLFFRLNVVQIELPPLRERVEDIAPLFAAFLERVAAMLGRTVEVSPEVAVAMRRYHWPGNVRELENFAERMVILNRTGTLTVDQLPHPMRMMNLDTASMSADEMKSLAETGFQLVATLEKTEWRLIDEALRRSAGNKAQASRLLGINRTTLVEKLRRRSEA